MQGLKYSRSLDDDIITILKDCKDLTRRQISEKLREKYGIKDNSPRFNLSVITSAVSVLKNKNIVTVKKSTLKGKITLISLNKELCE